MEKSKRDNIPLWLRAGLGVLASYRVAHMITAEDGPAYVFHNFRENLLISLPDPNAYQVHWISKGFHCPLCLSVWISIPVTAFLVLPARLGPVRKFLLFWLGIAGGVLIAHNIGGADNGSQ